MRQQKICREARLAYLDFFREVRDLAIGIPFHYPLFDEGLSPVVQALTLDEILSLHPTDGPIEQRVWICEDVVNLIVRKRNLWETTGPLPQLYRRTGTMMLVVPLSTKTTSLALDSRIPSTRVERIDA